MITTKRWNTKVNVPIEDIWKFFTRPENLNKLTPPQMNFEIQNDVSKIKMYEGMIIKYKVTPIPLMRITWITEITHIKSFDYFVDEQRVGPYKMWHHEHHFKEVEGGTEIVDILNYEIGKSFLGNIANSLFIENKIDNIFSFREKRINELFN